MNYQQAYDKLERHGQTQILKYYDELTEEQQNELLTQIEETDFDVIEACKAQEHLNDKGKVTPLASMQLEEINAKKDYFQSIGVEAIKAGKVGCVLLAGGMGTRLGSDAPKGVYNIGLTKDMYIFERLIDNLMDVVKLADTWIHLFVMTSDKNHDTTVSFFKEHAYFGYKEEYVTFFKQEMAPATDYNGKVYLEEKWKMSTSPNGNGGWFVSMKCGGVLDIVEKAGIEWLNIFTVDNVLQRMADPVFVGATIDAGCASGAKVVRKNAPDEKVGVICLEDGRPSIVEYYELTEELMNAKDADGNPAYYFGVILNYLFRVEDLKQIMERKLPLHVVEKKIPYLNEEGSLVKPEEPNGYKFETLVLDMIRELDTCLPFEIDRNKEFAPIKNKTGIDSVDTARELLVFNGIEL